ncbi:uncharacterized protein LOC108032041 [Drosophila biarmipes]|uniref:uncharacterized protein LOC108032041 n=1 Tax=Drosophila biarmipes TaxID=125945 RepID=UPI0007E6938F|nr:uncharacterized protein LOC108032041 [Drosophila biarmipes]
MHSPNTPLTSRCGYLRSRKRINSHPLTQLMKLAKAEKSGKPFTADTENTNVNPEDSNGSTEFDSSTNPESHPDGQNGGTDVDPDIGKIFENPF